MTDWVKQKCRPCKSGAKPMAERDIRVHLERLPGWSYSAGSIERLFEFENYFQTTAFVNAAVWIAHQEDHHPDISFGYKECVIRYTTHAIGGVSDNDFICAAKINALLDQED